jgi:serine/threonine-protein kinase HipA
VGSFLYDAAYRELAGALALDPHNLPFTRSQRAIRETRQDGLFGVLRDASPEGFGLYLLQGLGLALETPLDRLEASLGDAAGAVEVCDDIERKLSWKATASADLIAALANLDPEEPSTAALTHGNGRATSLGGERPKQTVLHEGQLWIAKLQMRGDPKHAPLREFAAMRSARAAGLNVAQTQFVRTAGAREMILVRRFDRHVEPSGAVHRRLYASAHTVLGLRGNEVRGEAARSYVALAHSLRRWCARGPAPVVELQRELFRRMVFNAVCGNGDDHPRNHCLIHGEAGWTLSPAFDIAPYAQFSGSLAMAVNREGSHRPAAADLLRDCESFGYDRVEAIEVMRGMIDAVMQAWPAAVQEAGFDASELPVPVCEWLNLEAAIDRPPPPRSRSRER